MRGTRAKLRNLLLGVALIPSALGEAWTPLSPPHPVYAMMAAKASHAQGRLVYAGDLVKMGYGSDFPAAQFRDPDLDLKIPVSLTEQYGEDRTHGQSKTAASFFLDFYPDLLSPSYLPVQDTKFRPGVLVNAYFKARSADIADETGDRAAILHHEGTHPLDQTSKAVKAIIENHPYLDDVLNEPLWGLGPALAKIIAAGDPERATRMRAEITALLNHTDGKKDNTSYSTYGFQATERIAFLSEVFSGAICSHSWKRLPATRAELYAAAYNLFGEIKLDPKQTDEVNQTLATPEGQAALKEFPAFIASQHNVTGDAIVLIKNTLHQLTPAERLAYYETVLPEDYGDVQEEVLGNPHGRTDLGLKASPNYGVAFAYHVIQSTYAGSDGWDAATYARIAKEVEPEVFLNVLKIAIQNGNVSAQAALYATFDRRFGEQAAAKKAEVLQLTLDARATAKKFQPTDPVATSIRERYYASIEQSIDFMTQSGFASSPQSAPDRTRASDLAPISGSRESSIAYRAR